MKVERNRAPRAIFASLAVGDVFEGKTGFHYLRIETKEGYNAVRMEDGVLCRVSSGEPVIVYPDATLLVNGQ